MRFSTTIATVCAATLCAGSLADAAPLITAFIGTPSAATKTAFFVLDFNDSGATPETYNFGWYYEGNKTGADFATALAGSLTGANGFTVSRYPSGFLQSFGYNGRVKDSEVEKFGYFSYWLGFDGATWTESQFGDQGTTLSNTPVYSTNPSSSTSELSGASWHGWRWVNDYRTDSATAPRTAQVAVVPEGGTDGLLALGIAALATVGRRKKR